MDFVGGRDAVETYSVQVEKFTEAEKFVEEYNASLPSILFFPSQKGQKRQVFSFGSRHGIEKIRKYVYENENSTIEVFQDVESFVQRSLKEDKIGLMVLSQEGVTPHEAFHLAMLSKSPEFKQRLIVGEIQNKKCKDVLDDRSIGKSETESGEIPPVEQTACPSFLNEENNGCTSKVENDEESISGSENSKRNMENRLKDTEESGNSAKITENEKVKVLFVYTKELLHEEKVNDVIFEKHTEEISFSKLQKKIDDLTNALQKSKNIKKAMLLPLQSNSDLQSCLSTEGHCLISIFSYEELIK